MRVIAGSAGGRRLKGPRARAGASGPASVRPSSDLIRGAIFSSLASLGVDMSRVLDLYAGSGALGIEALSRGAAWCDFVERDRSTCELIRENLRLTGFEDRARVYRRKAEKASEGLSSPYTLVMADPPYEDSAALRVLEVLSGSTLVEQGVTVLVVEHHSHHEPPKGLGPLSLTNSLRHGDSAVSIYR
jgi:16S rRNA (guanine966-N2)-methyltransferase